MWSSLLDSIRSLLGRRRFEDDLDEELRDHIERDVAHRLALGMTPSEARRTALAELGGVERVKDEVREARGVASWDELRGDLRFAVRRMRRTPRYAALVIVTLALGIGASTAVFSAVDGVLLKPLPFEEPERLVTLWQTKPKQGSEREDVAPGNFLDWAERVRGFERLAAANPWGVNLRSRDVTENIEAWTVSEGFLDVVGVRPVMGRGFNASDYIPNAGPVALLDHGFWRRRLGGDSAIIGRALTVDERPVTIIGVLPPGFALPDKAAMWLPWVPRADERESRFATYLRVFGRLRTGTTPLQVEGELTAIARELERAHPRANAGVRIAMVPMLDVLVGTRRPLLWTLLVAAGVLMVVTLANIAALHVTRIAAQQREASVRAALGASGVRLARPLVVEAVLLSLIGGALGVGFAWLGVRALHALGPADLPRLDAIAVDARATAAAIVLAAAAAALLALVPLRRLRGATAIAALGARSSTGSRATLRSRRVAVTLQLAMALTLLVGTTLLVSSFRRLLDADRGYRTERVLSFTTWVHDEYRDADARRRYARDVVGRLTTLPGVEQAAVGTALPLADEITGVEANVIPDGVAFPPGEEPEVRGTIVSGGWFEVLGVPLRRGRLLGDADDERAEKVVVVNEAFVRRFLPTGDPVGRMVRVGLMGAPVQRRVVGVVGDTRHARLDTPPGPGLYIPLAQQPSASLTFVMRTAVEPGSLANPVMRLMQAFDARVGVARVTTLEALLDLRLRERRFLLVLIGAFAALAVALASVGVFGVLSQAVVERRREIGVRMVLGAAPHTILQQFLREAALMALFGVAGGLTAAAFATRGLSAFLYEVGRFDARSFAGAAGIIVLLALLAALVPTLRAARTDPARVLGADG